MKDLEAFFDILLLSSLKRVAGMQHFLSFYFRKLCLRSSKTYL